MGEHKRQGITYINNKSVQSKYRIKIIQDKIPDEDGSSLFTHKNKDD